MKLPEFVIAETRLGDYPVLIRTREPVVFAAVHEFTSEEKALEFAGNVPVGSMTRFGNTMYILVCVYHYSSKSMVGQKLEKVMRRMADWWLSILIERAASAEN